MNREAILTTVFTMEDVKDLSVKLTKWHKYSPQYKVELTKNGNKMDHIVVMGYPSVSVVIFNTTHQMLLLIKHFRIQNMFVSIREKLCAGLCDKDRKSDLEIVVEEVEEECGYKVDPDQLEFVQNFCEGGAWKMIYYFGKCCMYVSKYSYYLAG